MTIHLLSIEDTEEVQILVKKTFLNSADVICVDTLQKGAEVLLKNKIDAILLDLKLPDGDGFAWLSRLKENEKYVDIPVIILTSKNQIQDKVMGFHLGAEDYILKPFDPIELKVRVESKVKQRQQAKEQESMTQVGNLFINHLEQTVKISTISGMINIELTPTEFKILSYFVKRKDHVLDREQIINAAWKYGFNISDRTVDSHISRIRKKLSGSEYSIYAIQNVGYRFLKQSEKKSKCLADLEK